MNLFGASYGATAAQVFKRLYRTRVRTIPRIRRRNMAGAEQIWPNSLQIVEPGQSHSVNLNAWWQCDGGLVQTFVESASVTQLNTGCLAHVILPSFATSW